MNKNFNGGAVISYAPTLPAANQAFDGSLFYKSAGTDKGLYVLAFNQDADLVTIGDQVTQDWNVVISADMFVSKLGDEMTGPLQITSTSTSSAFGSGEEELTLHNPSTNAGARSGAIRWTYGTTPPVSAQLDVLLGSSNSKATMAFSTRGTTGTLAERMRLDENGLTIGGNAVWHAGNDGAGSGLNADLLDGLSSAYFQDATNLTSGTLGAARLPFMPVQQGGGTGQGTNKVYIGWASPKLLLQVDATNFGSTWPIDINGNAATSNFANSATTATSASTVPWSGVTGFPTAQYVEVAGDTMTGSLVVGTGAGDQIIVNGITLDWTTSVISTSTNVTAARFLAAAGSVSSPSIAFNPDGAKDTGFYWGGDGYINIASNGVYAGQWQPGGDLVVVGGLTASTVLGLNTVTAGNTGVGSAAIVVGNAGATGYLSFVGANSVRAGYIGVAANVATQDTGTVNYTAGNHTFAGSIHTNGAVETTGNNFPQFRQRGASTGGLTFYDELDPDNGIYNYSLFMDSGTVGFYFSTTNTAYNLGTQKFGVDYNGNVTATGNITAYSSDARLKMNIAPIENAIEKVLSIGGYSYDWNAEACEVAGFVPANQHEHGLIAQEVQKVMPDAVAPAPFNADYLTVRYERIVALLSAAIAEQQAQIISLETRLKTLEQGE